MCSSCCSFVFFFFFCWSTTKERKFSTQKFKAAAAIEYEEVEDISLKEYYQYQRRDGELRSSGERIHVAVRSHKTNERRRRWVVIVAVLL